jgi:MFS family permease
VLAVLVFGLGECLYDTVFGPLVSDLAPEAARGRYMAVGGFAWQLGFIAGPGLGGLLLTAGGAALWLPAAAVCIVGGLAAVRLDRELPDAYRTTPK